LSLVCDREDAFGLALSPFAQLPPDARSVAILPSGLHERSSDVAVSCLGDFAAFRRVAAGVQARHEPQVGREGSRRLEALNAVKLGDEDHRDGRVDAPKAAEPRDVVAIQGQLRGFLELTIHGPEATLRLFDRQDVFGHHDAIDFVVEDQRLQPCSVSFAPESAR